MNKNLTIIGGNLCADPEIRYTANGNPVVNLRLATNENWTDKNGQRQERTEFHRIVVWGKTAENCAQYLSKGSEALIEGKLQTRSWEDRDGNTRYTTEIIARDVQFGRHSKENNNNNTQTSEVPTAEAESSVAAEAEQMIAEF